MAGLVGRLVDAVDDERLGDRLDAVDDVVQPDRQLVDVLTIERRDERVLEPSVDLAVDLVATLLERLDLGDALVELVVVARASRRRAPAAACEVLTVGHEQLEEADVLGKQAERHRRLLAQPKPDGVQDEPRPARRPIAGGGDGDDPGEQDAPGDAPADALAVRGPSRRP